MKTYSILPLLVFFALDLHAADPLVRPDRVFAEIKDNLSAAVKAASHEANLVGKNPTLGLFKLQELLPLAARFLNIDFASSTNGNYNGETWHKLIQGKTLRALFDKENRISITSSQVAYVVKANFCQALREDLEAESSPMCDKLIALNKLLFEVTVSPGMHSIALMWEDALLSNIQLTSNSLVKTTNLATLFGVIQEVKNDTSVVKLSGQVGTEFKFSTEAKPAECPNQARSCLSILANTVHCEIDNGCAIEISSFPDNTQLLTLEVYQNDVAKLDVALGQLKVGIPWLVANLEVNKLKTGFQLQDHLVTLENLSKGEGHLDFLAKRFQVNINDEKNVPKISISRDTNKQTLISVPASTFSIVVRDLKDSFAEDLSLSLRSPDGKPIEITWLSHSTDAALTINDQPVSKFHSQTISSNPADFFFLEPLLKAAISKVAAGSKVGINDGELELNYNYGQQDNNDLPKWFGFIKFVMSIGDFLRTGN